MTSDDRAVHVDEAMRLTWASLESHLAWTHRESRGKYAGSKQFHRNTIKGYARLIYLLSKLY
jgi:hypothetical protein